MFEITLQTVNKLQSTAMKLESITYLQQLLIEDNGGWIDKADPERFKKDIAADLIFNLQHDTAEELHELLFSAPFM